MFSLQTSANCATNWLVVLSACVLDNCFASFAIIRAIFNCSLIILRSLVEYAVELVSKLAICKLFIKSSSFALIIFSFVFCAALSTYAISVAKYRSTVK